MTTLHLHRTIESETLHLPELKAFIGQSVEIIVLGIGSGNKADSPPAEWLPGFWKSLSQGWQGEPLVRPEQGTCDDRDALR